MAASGFMGLPVALVLLVAYFLLSIEIYLATYCLGAFRLSFWRFGPTELRLLLMLGNVVLLSDVLVFDRSAAGERAGRACYNGRFRIPAEFTAVRRPLGRGAEGPRSGV